MFDSLSPWKRDAPARSGEDTPAPAVLARRRASVWIEFKRLHLGFGQALNALTFGHSNTLALIRHAMLAEYEARRLRGTAEEGRPDLAAGEAMRQAISRCQGAYRRVNTAAFDDKALSGFAGDADPHLIALMLTLTTAPFRTADFAVAAALGPHDEDAGARAARFTPEIENLHTQLRTHFTELARRAGLA